MRRCRHGQRADPQGGLAVADGDALAVLAAGTGRTHGEVVAHHVDVAQHFGAAADEVGVAERLGDVAVGDQVGLGHPEDEVTGGGIDLAAAQLGHVHPVRRLADDLLGVLGPRQDDRCWSCGPWAGAGSSGDGRCRCCLGPLCGPATSPTCSPSTPRLGSARCVPARWPSSSMPIAPHSEPMVPSSTRVTSGLATCSPRRPRKTDASRPTRSASSPWPHASWNRTPPPPLLMTTGTAPLGAGRADSLRNARGGRQPGQLLDVVAVEQLPADRGPDRLPTRLHAGVAHRHAADREPGLDLVVVGQHAVAVGHQDAAAPVGVDRADLADGPARRAGHLVGPAQQIHLGRLGDRLGEHGHRVGRGRHHPGQGDRSARPRRRRGPPPRPPRPRPAGPAPRDRQCGRIPSSRPPRPGCRRLAPARTSAPRPGRRPTGPGRCADPRQRSRRNRPPCAGRRPAPAAIPPRRSQTPFGRPRQPLRPSARSRLTRRQLPSRCYKPLLQAAEELRHHGPPVLRAARTVGSGRPGR